MHIYPYILWLWVVVASFYTLATYSASSCFSVIMMSFSLEISSFLPSFTLFNILVLIISDFQDAWFISFCCLFALYTVPFLICGHGLQDMCKDISWWPCSAHWPSLIFLVLRDNVLGSQKICQIINQKFPTNFISFL